MNCYGEIRDMENIEILFCDQCGSKINGDPIEHMDHDEFVFCSEKCFELFFEKKSEEQDEQWNS